MKEPELYRVMLEQVNAAAAGKMILSITDAAKILGVSRSWCYEHLQTKDGHITTVSLAWQMAKM